MTIIIGDFWNHLAAARSPGFVSAYDYRHFHFARHLVSDGGEERGLRAADRIELTEAFRVAFHAIYSDKLSRAARAGVDESVRRALHAEALYVQSAIRGFTRAGQGYELELNPSTRGVRGGGTRQTSWEFRRLREAVLDSRLVGLGFERRPPRLRYRRSYYSVREHPGLLDLDGRNGATPWGDMRDRSVFAMSIISGELQQLRLSNMTRQMYPDFGRYEPTASRREANPAHR